MNRFFYIEICRFQVNGSYYLGPRSVTELEAYILEEYETAIKCHLCQKLCLHVSFEVSEFDYSSAFGFMTLKDK